MKRPKPRTDDEEEGDPSPVKREVIGPEALRERLRLLAPGFLTLRVYREDVVFTLQLLDELQVAHKGLETKTKLKKRTKGRKFENAREAASPDRVPKLCRLRKDVVEGIEGFAKSKGTNEPWSFGRAINELLAAAFCSERAP